MFQTLIVSANVGFIQWFLLGVWQNHINQVFYYHHQANLTTYCQYLFLAWDDSKSFRMVGTDDLLAMIPSLWSRETCVCTTAGWLQHADRMRKEVWEECDGMSFLYHSLGKRCPWLEVVPSPVFCSPHWKLSFPFYPEALDSLPLFSMSLDTLWSQENLGSNMGIHSYVHNKMLWYDDFQP